MGIISSRVVSSCGTNKSRINPASSNNKANKSPLLILPPELRQDILLRAIGDNNLAFAIFSTFCRTTTRPGNQDAVSIWPTHDFDTSELKAARSGILKKSLRDIGFLHATIHDWSLLEELFGGAEDLEELLETTWKRLARIGVVNGMLAIVDGAYHVHGCGGQCLQMKDRVTFWDYAKWHRGRGKTAASALCF